MMGIIKRMFAQKKERRKNRGTEPVDRLAVRFARMQRTLIEISNITRSRMGDAEFRDFAQDAAHHALEELNRKGFT